MYQGKIRHAHTTAHLLQILFTKTFDGSRGKMFRIKWYQFRNISEVEKVTKDYLQSIRQILQATRFDLIILPDGCIVVKMNDIESIRMPPRSLLKKYGPEVDESQIVDEFLEEVFYSRGRYSDNHDYSSDGPKSRKSRWL